jgi:aarF domain-containing kinase
VRVDVNYATLLINVLCLEGLADALDPRYNLLDRARMLLQPHSNRFVRPVYAKVGADP